MSRWAVPSWIRVGLDIAMKILVEYMNQAQSDSDDRSLAMNVYVRGEPRSAVRGYRDGGKAAMSVRRCCQWHFAIEKVDCTEWPGRPPEYYKHTGSRLP